jgi:catechol 2,3-dioxygenase-like lactoylglutathione lyase family enzyme
MILGIEHFAIATPDVEKLSAWYVETLGFTINYRGKTAIFAKAQNGMMIEFIPAEGDAPGHTVKTPGLRHIAILVKEFGKEVEALRARQVRFLDEPAVKGGNKVVFFTDPEGNILHLLERETPLG